MTDHKLQIVLAAKDATKSAFLSAQGRVAAFTKSVFSLRGAMVATAGAAAMGALIKKSLETVDAIGKAADVIGISTDALQEYRHAARIAGVSTELMDNSFKAFSKRVGEARNETGALVTFLKKFDEQLLENIQNSGSTEEALNLLMDRMGRTADQTDRAALAAAAFSRSGLVLTNMVKDGAAGLEKMRQEARDLGIVLEENLIRQSEKANDELEKLTRVIKVQFMGAVAGLAPEIAKAAEQTTNWWKANQDMTEALKISADGVIKFTGFIADYAVAWVKTWQALGLATTGQISFNTALFDGVAALERFNQEYKRYPIGPGTKGWEIYQPSTPTAEKDGGGKGGAADRGKELSTELQQYYGWWSAYGDSMEAFYTTNSKVYLDATKSDIEKSKEAYAAMYGYLQFEGDGYYEYRLSQIQQETEAYAAATGNQALAYQMYIERVKELDQERQDAAEQSNKWLVDLSERTSDAIEDNFSKFFKDFFGGELDSAKDYFQAFCNSLSNSFSDMLGQMMKEMMFGGGSGGGSGLFGSLFSGLGGLFGGGGGGGGYNASDWASTLWHKGGTVGKDTAPMRIVPASLFAHAPRLHKGLAPDEFPAILQQGETVTPRGQAGSQVKNLTVISNLTVEGDMDRRAASLHLADVEEKVKEILREEMR